MALLGLSLVLASVIYAVIWKPPFVQTLIALWRGHPQIQQPPTTARPPPPELRVEEDRPTDTTDENEETLSSSPAPTSQTAADQAAMPPPSISIATPRSTRSGSASSQARSTPSPQTTPKATASTMPNGSSSSIPSFSLTPNPPASAAAVARTVEAETSPSALPTLSAPSPPPQPLPAPASPSLSAALAAPSQLSSMAPPPRPPALNAINNAGGSGSSLLGVPSRGPIPNRQQPQHSYDRQPGTSTLAPPPSHSSKPAKPSRKVILEPGRSPLDWARLANSPASDLRNLGPGAPYLRVTPSMLKRQTGRKGKDAWTALGGRVYNITPYLPFHPGGEPELLRAAGRDGSKLFGEIHPWVNYENMLASSMIGLLVDEHEAKSKGEMDNMD
ncbi:hypothetical protein F4821DRAFT_124662 [Hypoxylon rubiginosum]|uniref:Uncharacterized protein n=1 Tax=Hypoxylon rubiginosum TaxID=110542 RepID=A0ACC0D247_9PEZI|nr:hypothetical protein F4821DRAFT_124662 [Hypoxylon rubiginosum]